MKVYGEVSLSEGSDIKNLTIAHGPAYPDHPNTGELFYHDSLGLSFHNGTAWKVVEYREAQIYNGALSIDYVDGRVNKIIPEFQFKPSSTQLYVGGLRQTLGLDYDEVGDHLVLNFELTNTDISNGINITLDYIAQNS